MMPRVQILIVLTLISACIVEYTSGSLLRNSHCKCSKYDCGCCVHVEVDSLHVDGKLCTNYTYLPEEYGISLTITYDTFALFNETISAKNPPPICVIHVDNIHMQICLRFYNMDIKDHHLAGCAEFEVSFLGLVHLKRYQLGCFGFGSNNYGPKFQDLIDIKVPSVNQI